MKTHTFITSKRNYENFVFSISMSTTCCQANDNQVIVEGGIMFSEKKVNKGKRG